MNKGIIIILLLLSSCGLISKKKTSSTTIIANISTNLQATLDLDLKLRTELYRDSMVLSLSHSLGFNLATFLVKEDNVYVTNRLNNEESSFSILDFDPEINLKQLVKSAIQNKIPNEPRYYKTSQLHYVFSDYINVKIVNRNSDNMFLPRQLSINRFNNGLEQKIIKIMIDYKLVKFNK